MILDDLIEDRANEQRLLGYDSNINYVGSGVFVYPRFMPYWRLLNWPACQHDYNYDRHDRSTWSNKQMIEDFATELILDTKKGKKEKGRHPASLNFILPMLYFYVGILPIITVIGRFIDKE